MNDHSKAPDKVAARLAYLLVQLNQGETISPQTIVARFGVNLRTAQRDINRLNQGMSQLGLGELEPRGEGYALPLGALGRVTAKDIRRYAELSGTSQLFPRIDNGHLLNLLQSDPKTLVVRSWASEDLQQQAALFQRLRQAISEHRRISFMYREQLRVAVCPYRLVNEKGIWYLSAREGDELKTFTFSKISLLDMSEQRFSPDPAVIAQLEQANCGWVGDQTTVFRIRVAAAVADYFRRRPLIVNQTIVEERADGDLILEARVSYPPQTLAVVRYWIPHLVILDPAHLQTQLEDELQAYLNQRSRDP